MSLEYVVPIIIITIAFYKYFQNVIIISSDYYPLRILLPGNSIESVEFDLKNSLPFDFCAVSPNLPDTSRTGVAFKTFYNYSNSWKLMFVVNKSVYDPFEKINGISIGLHVETGGRLHPFPTKMKLKFVNKSEDSHLKEPALTRCFQCSITSEWETTSITFSLYHSLEGRNRKSKCTIIINIEVL